MLPDRGVIYGEISIEAARDTSGMVQGMRDLRAFLSEEGIGFGRSGEGGGSEGRGLRGL